MWRCYTPASCVEFCSFSFIVKTDSSRLNAMKRIVGPRFAPQGCAISRNSGIAGTALATCVSLLAACSVEAQQSLRKGDQIAGQATVVDGASFDIKSNRIRLWGIDAPERGASCYRNGRRWKPADDAAAALRRCVGGKTVTCRVWSVKREWFRMVHVSECWTHDGQDVARCMVRGGWASDYTCFSDGYYRDLETEAKNKGLGLWSCDHGPGTGAGDATGRACRARRPTTGRPGQDGSSTSVIEDSRVIPGAPTSMMQPVDAGGDALDTEFPSEQIDLASEPRDFSVRACRAGKERKSRAKRSDRPVSDRRDPAVPE
jgi:endonuclease YncB( thermonuclease family)